VAGGGCITTKTESKEKEPRKLTKQKRAQNRRGKRGTKTIKERTKLMSGKGASVRSQLPGCRSKLSRTGLKEHSLDVGHIPTLGRGGC